MHSQNFESIRYQQTPLKAAHFKEPDEQLPTDPQNVIHDTDQYAFPTRKQQQLQASLKTLIMPSQNFESIKHWQPPLKAARFKEQEKQLQTDPQHVIHDTDQ